jgi:hypothetical protein
MEHHDLHSGLEEGVNHVAADVAGTASDQDGHVASDYPCLPAAAKNPPERERTRSRSVTRQRTPM